MFERRLKCRKRALDTGCIRTTLRKNSMEGSNVTETSRESGGRREWGSSKMGRCLDFRRAACFRDISLPIAERCHLAGNPGLEC